VNLCYNYDVYFEYLQRTVFQTCSIQIQVMPDGNRNLIYTQTSFIPEEDVTKTNNSLDSLYQ